MGQWSVVLSGSPVDIDATYGTSTTAQFGVGMPPLEHNVTPYALIPGALLQSIKVQPRVLQLTFTVAGATLAAYHSIRKDLLAAFAPNVGGTLAPVELRYSGASATVVKILGYYDGGLEGETRSGGNFESIAARFICYDPFYYVTSTTNVDVSEFASVADADYAVKSVAGVWSNINTAFNGTVKACAIDASGNMYLGGSFTNVGDANGDYIVKVAASDGALSSLGTGMNGEVRCLALGPDGTLYAGGEFALAGGVANTDGIAKWDGAVWTPLGTGVSGGTVKVQALAFDANGYLYATGFFTAMGGVADTARIAKWDGAVWTALGTGFDDYGLCILVTPDQLVYVGGQFTTAGGTAVEAMAVWDGTAWANAGDAAWPASVDALVAGPDGTIYAGGNPFVARRVGTVWENIMTSNYVISLAFDDAGRLWAGGVIGFAWPGAPSAGDNIAMWNGSVWSATPIDLPGAAEVWEIAIRGTRMLIGYSTAGTATAAAQTTVTNGGTAPAYPTITVVRAGGTTALVQYLKNETTGQTLYLNYDLLAGETLTITLTQGAKAITSSFFGNVIGRALLPNSDFATWCLQPGANTVSLYVYAVGAPTLTTTCSFVAPHWGVDGVAA